jgi:protein-S-isoprenylcysteine O-methyltransferase Ste14
LLFLFFVPEVSFALRPGYGWTALLAMSGWQRQLGLELLLALALPGIGAVLEFFQRGLGTPIPYDPPKRLVTSGIYRYCANPMQISCTLTMALWAAMLRNPWLLAAPGLAVLYSAGIARWDERQDLEERFGEEWRTYREQVGNWIPRWKPYAAGEPARLYLASTCSPCSELRRWIERRSPRGLEILPAESLPLSSIQRMTYDPNDGSPAESGLRAMGRALEHLNLGWAMAGTALRLPGVWQFVQLLMDASGLGPRKLVCQPQSEMHSQRS